MSRNPFAHLFFHICIFRIIREVMPFPLIFLVTIQLFSSVSIYDIPVAFGSNAIILVSKWGGFCCVLKLGLVGELFPVVERDDGAVNDDSESG